MFTAQNYIVAQSIEEAFMLNQKRANVIIGGMHWLKMSKKNIHTAISLSALGLDTIQEEEDYFSIGCMCSLRSLELSERLNTYFDGCIKESVKSIVGTQFRNTATVGGSIFSRFGFSDLAACLLSLYAEVETFQRGNVPLSIYLAEKRDNDILVRVLVPKKEIKACFLSHRATATDLPILNCAVSRCNEIWQVVLGARPARAVLVPNELSKIPSEKEIENLIRSIQENIIFQSNMRGSALYRRHLSGVLVKRGIEEILGGKNAD